MIPIYIITKANKKFANKVISHDRKEKEHIAIHRDNQTNNRP